ncbi:MAG: HAD hydrolase-like protein [Methylocella sp.]
MYRLVIFDFDGTLADSGEWAARALNRLAARYGFRSVSDEEIAMLRGQDTRAVLRYLGIRAWKLPFIVKDMRRQMAEETPFIPLFEGTEAMLRSLVERGIAVALVSSNSEDNVRRILGGDCAALIGCYECGASVFGKKSKFRRVLRQTRAANSEVICIGDEARDIEAASGAGLASGAVTWGYATAEFLERQRPTMLFGEMKEIAERLSTCDKHWRDGALNEGAAHIGNSNKSNSFNPGLRAEAAQ